MSITRNEKGEWNLSRHIKGAHPAYEEMMLKCLNAVDKLYVHAKSVSEFEFVASLLRVDGLRDAGWDTFETIQDVFRTFNFLKNKCENRQSAYLALFVYGLIFEASEPYEILANLLNTVEGRSYNINNFPDQPDQYGRLLSQHPNAKIDQLKKRAKKMGHDLSFFDDFTDSKLRNAIFHCEYTVYWPHIRTMRPPKESLLSGS